MGSLPIAGTLFSVHGTFVRPCECVRITCVVVLYLLKSRDRLPFEEEVGKVAYGRLLQHT